MKLSGGSGELVRAGFGVLAATSAQIGPSVLARNDVGVRDTKLRHGQERTSWASQLWICANLQGMLTSNGDRSSSGLVPPKNG